MTKSFAAVAALCALGTFAVPQVTRAQVTKRGDGYVLKMKFFPGQKLKYVLYTTAPSAPGQPGGKVEVPTAWTVKSVEGSVATLNVVAGPGTLNGEVRSPAQPSTMKINNQGKIINSSVPGAQGISGIVLPDRPIKVGETFSVDNTINAPSGAIKLKNSYKFVGLKTVRGKRVAQLALTATGSGAMNMKGSGTYNIDVADGQLNFADVTQQAVIQQGGKSETLTNKIQLIRK